MTEVVVAAVDGVILAKAGNLDKNMFVDMLSMFKKLFFLHNQMTTFVNIIINSRFSSQILERKLF